MTSDLKMLAALTSLNDMMAKGYLNICTINTIAEMLGINPKGDAHRTLHPLHCVNFEKMPAQLRQAIPGLIRECLSIEPTYQFPSPVAKAEPEPVATAQPEKRGQLMGLLR